MGYLPRFKNDLFISYRHASNEAHDKWVDTFCKELHARLKDLVGEVEIWRDNDEIRAGDQWRPEIIAALDNTAIFLAIISKTYLDSDVCRSELDQFLGYAKKESAMQRRIVPIFKQPPKSDQDLPQELGEIDHHEFYQWDPPGSNRFLELGPGKDDAVARLFWEKFEWLTQDLMDILETLKGVARKQAIGTVYLARVGPELTTEREKLRSDLQQRGYMIVPEREYLWNASGFREKIIADFEAAILCVHLVARTASIVPETHEHVMLQLKLATEVMKRNKKPLPLVWIQPSNQTNATASELIDYIEKELANEGVEYWQGGLENFKTQIHDKLLKSQAQPAQGANKPASQIALFMEEGDLAVTGEINTLFVNKLKVETNRICFSGTVAKYPTSLEKTLARCERCVVFWGGQSEEWVKDILAMDELAGHIGHGSVCVYAAVPTTPEKSTFCTSKARLILEAAGRTEDELREFLATAEGVQ